MGMFDYVAVECPVEGIENPAAVEWQTKAFDAPFLDHYRITAEGRLLREVVHYEDRSDPSAEGAMRYVGCMTPVHEGWLDTAYHGDLRMIGQFGREFIWLVARFNDGQLVWVEREYDAAARSPETGGGTP